MIWVVSTLKPYTFCQRTKVHQRLSPNVQQIDRRFPVVDILLTDPKFTMTFGPLAPMPFVACVSKPLSFSSICTTLRWQHQPRTAIWSSEKSCYRVGPNSNVFSVLLVDQSLPFFRGCYATNYRLYSWSQTNIQKTETSESVKYYCSPIPNSCNSSSQQGPTARTKK